MSVFRVLVFGFWRMAAASNPTIDPLFSFKL